MFIIVYKTKSSRTGIRYYFNGFQIGYSFQRKAIWHSEVTPNLQWMIFATKEMAQKVIDEDIKEVDGQAVSQDCSIHVVYTNPVS